MQYRSAVLKRTVLFLVCMASVAVSAPSITAQDRSSYPNVLVILADDLGYADIGVHRGCEVPTPHLDALAGSGVRCSAGYVTAPYCSPSRAGFLTGRSQTRFGHEFNPHQGNEEVLGLPLDQTTIANVLQSAGYATSVIGKWHLGVDAAHHPLSRGFGEYFGFLSGAHNFFLNPEKSPVFGRAYSSDSLLRGREPQTLPGFTTELFTDEAIAFMNRSAARPWFLYLSYNAVHTPLEISAAVADRIPADVSDPNRRGYLALLLGLDDAIGRLMQQVRANHPNTLVFFLSDNGGSGRKPFFAFNAAVNLPLKGDKGQVWEGGIRVPFFVSWPGRLPAATVYDQPVSAIDILPTACAAAGAAAPDAVEGVNLVPYLCGEKNSAPHPALYWRFGPQKAIRKGRWKLVDARDFQAKTQTGWQLYDLQTDLSESRDLTATMPQLAQELAADWDAWNRSNIPPRWIGTPNEDPQGTAATAPK